MVAAQGLPVHEKDCPEARAEYADRHTARLRERIREVAEAGRACGGLGVPAAGVVQQQEVDLCKGTFSERRRLLYEATKERRYCRNSNSWSY